MASRNILLGVILMIATTAGALALPWPPVVDQTLTVTAPVIVTYRAVRVVVIGPPSDYGARNAQENIVKIEGATTLPHHVNFNGTFFNIPATNQNTFRTLVRANWLSPGCLDLIATAKSGYWTLKRLANLEPAPSDRALVIEIPPGSTVQFTSLSNIPSVQVVAIPGGGEVKCHSYNN